MKPLVCIIIVNWNGGKTMVNCLKSLRKTDYPNYKVIVIDNGSTDETPNIIKKRFKEVDLVRLHENRGYTSGINCAWNYCLSKYKPKYLCSMNNDIVTIQATWLSRMVEVLEKEKKAGICANKLLFPDGRLQIYPGDVLPPEYIEKDRGQFDFIKEVRVVGGANFLIRSEVIKKIGGVDENFFYGPDDIDYCLRARKAGFKIFYNGFSKSIHVGSFSYLSASKDFIYGHQSYGKMLFYFRHQPPIEKVTQVFQQFARAFFTRKDPFRKRKMRNIYFHKTFPKRIYLFSSSFVRALKNYKHVKIGDYPLLKKSLV